MIQPTSPRTAPSRQPSAACQAAGKKFESSKALDLFEGVAVWGGSVLAGSMAPLLIPAAGVAGMCLSKVHGSDNEEALKLGFFTAGLATVGMTAAAIGIAPAAVGVAALIGYRAMM